MYVSCHGDESGGLDTRTYIRTSESQTHLPGLQSVNEFGSFTDHPLSLKVEQLKSYAKKLYVLKKT